MGVLVPPFLDPLSQLPPELYYIATWWTSTPGPVFGWLVFPTALVPYSLTDCLTDRCPVSASHMNTPRATEHLFTGIPDYMNF